ncbi:C4-type zinc ribbon domain-containing protein [Bdellovibrionota bacterium FG-2]
MMNNVKECLANVENKGVLRSFDFNEHKRGTSLSPIREIFESLLELQKLDSQVATILGKGSTHPDVVSKEHELAFLLLQESAKVVALKDLSLREKQTKVALELCFGRYLKAEAAIQQTTSPSVKQSAITKVDQLRVLKQDLELKEHSIAKDCVALQTDLTSIQSKRAALQKIISSTLSLSREGEQSVAEQIRKIELLKAQVMPKLPVRYAILYQRLLNARKGVAISKLSGATCGACHMILPAQFVAELINSPVVEQCPACSRLLVPQFNDREAD